MKIDNRQDNQLENVLINGIIETGYFGFYEKIKKVLQWNQEKVKSVYCIPEYQRKCR